MKKFLTILFLLPLLALLVGCNDENILLTERDKIEKYLTSSRRMVAEEELGNTIEEEPAFFSIIGRYAYRHIVNYYDAEREDKSVVEWGDDLQVRFTAYIFTGSEPSQSSIYLSNVPEVIEQLGKKSGNTLAWPREPLNIKLGTTKILKGVESVLSGCHEADSVQVFMTSNLAYGDEIMGVIPKESMIAWYMKIEKVTK